MINLSMRYSSNDKSNNRNKFSIKTEIVLLPVNKYIKIYLNILMYKTAKCNF